MSTEYVFIITLTIRLVNKGFLKRNFFLSTGNSCRIRNLRTLDILD